MWFALRDTFHCNTSGVHLFVVSWNPESCSYLDFKEGLIGPVDPKKAQLPRQKDCIRLKFWSEWQECGLAEQGIRSPEFNALHASSSPFEGLVEQMIWFDEDVQDDPTGFGSQVISLIGKEKLQEWMCNPRFALADGSEVNVFDYLEHSSSDECLRRLKQMANGTAYPLNV